MIRLEIRRQYKISQSIDQHYLASKISDMYAIQHILCTWQKIRAFSKTYLFERLRDSEDRGRVVDPDHRKGGLCTRGCSVIHTSPAARGKLWRCQAAAQYEGAAGPARAVAQQHRAGARPHQNHRGCLFRATGPARMAVKDPPPPDSVGAAILCARLLSPPPLLSHTHTDQCGRMIPGCLLRAPRSWNCYRSTQWSCPASLGAAGVRACQSVSSVSVTNIQYYTHS